MAQLRDQVAGLMGDFEVVTQERDRLVEGASKVAKEHRLRVVEMETVRADAEKAAAHTVEQAFVPVFESRLEELKVHYKIHAFQRRSKIVVESALQDF